MLTQKKIRATGTLSYERNRLTFEHVIRIVWGRNMVDLQR